MDKFNGEIKKRRDSKFWTQEMAERVLHERSRRIRRNTAVAGFLFIALVMLVSAGFNIYRSNLGDNSWENYLISTVTEHMETKAVPEEVDGFIEYSFNGN